MDSYMLANVSVLNGLDASLTWTHQLWEVPEIHTVTCSKECGTYSNATNVVDLFAHTSGCFSTKTMKDPQQSSLEKLISRKAYSMFSTRQDLCICYCVETLTLTATSVAVGIHRDYITPMQEMDRFVQTWRHQSIHLFLFRNYVLCCGMCCVVVLCCVVVCVVVCCCVVLCCVVLCLLCLLWLLFSKQVSSYNDIHPVLWMLQ